MHLKIKCLTDGARVAGKAMRATQELEGDFDAADVAQIKIAAAAGDVEFAVIDEPAPEKPAHRAKASDKP